MHHKQQTPLYVGFRLNSLHIKSYSHQNGSSYKIQQLPCNILISNNFYSKSDYYVKINVVLGVLYQKFINYFPKSCKASLLYKLDAMSILK